MPGDGEGRPLVLQLPHVVGEPRSGLMAVAEVALVPGYPVPDGAVGDAGVGFLQAGGFSFRLYLVGHIFFTFLLWCRMVPISLA